MILKCRSEDLSTACGAVQRAVPSKASLPALEGILLRAEDGMLTLCGYDLQLGITTKIPAEIKEPGAVIINAKLLADVTRHLPEEDCVIKTDEKYTALVRSGEAEFSLLGFKEDEYPELPEIESRNGMTLPCELLGSMISQTIFAAAQTESKPVYTGVLFELGGGTIRLVAVDGYRIAIRTEAAEGICDARFIVPGKTLSEINRLMSEDDINVNIKVGSRHIVFETGSYCIISRLLEGEFLDYGSVIPSSGTTCVKAKTRELIGCIDRISLMITEQDRCPVRCIFEGDQLKASCVTARGRSSDNVAVELSGAKVELGVNSRFLLDALRAASDCDEVKIELGGPVSPIKILPSEGQSFLFLILPVRLKNNG